MKEKKKYEQQRQVTDKGVHEPENLPATAKEIIKKINEKINLQNRKKIVNKK